MVTNNPEPQDENEEVGAEKIPSYEDLVTEEPEREVNLEDYKPPSQTLSEEEEETTKLTDKQSILRALTPKFRNKAINDFGQSAMVSRIFPDNYQDKQFITIASIMEQQCENEDFDPILIVCQVQDVLSIGYEGRGIADRLELAGAMDDAEMERLSKDLGL
jgi:hypothetical protein